MGFFLFLFCFGLLSYFGSFTAGFVLDDYSAIVHNPFIKHLNPLLIWGREHERFLTNVTFALNYVSGGLHVVGWHAINLLIHVTVSFFVFLLTLATWQTPALKNSISKYNQYVFSSVTACIFLVHPIQTQSVIYLAQRATLLSALFYLAALYCYVNFRLNEECLCTRRFYGAAIFCVIGGIFSKPNFVTLPLAILCYEACFFGFEKGKNVSFKRLFLLFVFFLPGLVIPFMLMGPQRLNILISEGSLPAGQAGAAAPFPFQYLLTQFNVLVVYLKLLFFPLGLNFDYDFKISKGFFEFPTYLSFTALSLIIFLGFRLRKTKPLIAFGIFWFFTTLLADSSLFPLADVIFEHRLYLSCYGFALGLTFFLWELLKDQKKFLTVSALILVALFILTEKRCFIWGDPLRLMQDAVAKSPRKARVHHNLGAIYYERGEIGKAKNSFEEALRYDPGYVVAKNNLGMIAVDEHQVQKAENIFRELILKYPDYYESYINLASLYEKDGKDSEAMRLFNESLLKNPYSCEAYIGMGNIDAKKGNLKNAEIHFQKAIWLNPDSALGRYDLGNVYYHVGRFYESLLEYERAVKIKPRFFEAYNNMGNIFFYFGDRVKAEENFRKAVEANPNFAEGYVNLANVFYELGYIQESRRQAGHAAEIYRREGNIEKAKTLEERIVHMPAVRMK